MKKLVLIWVLLQATYTWAAPQIIKPGVQSKTSFAIVIDSKSYEKAKASVDSYRKAVEKDGLGTYILSDDWQSAQEIRNMLEELYRQKKSPLEGAVFIGDIPIPMVRDAQFLSSAFKMDQRMDWKRSSVPSDRYYDDFDLKFDFLKRDEQKPLYFYFSLATESAQAIRSDIYSARIKPVVKPGTDKYVLLTKYLDKVVKAHKEENPVNSLTMFALALFLAPLFLMVPAAATSPALIIVGLFMISSVVNISFDDMSEALPAFLTITMMPFTFSIANGIVFGMLSYVIIKALVGKFKHISTTMWVIFALLLLKMTLEGMHAD